MIPLRNYSPAVLVLNSISTSYVNSISNSGQVTTCSDDPDMDTASEAGLKTMYLIHNLFFCDSKCKPIDFNIQLWRC